MPQQKKTRLDLLLVELRLAESRSLAQRLILAGRVRVEGEILMTPQEFKEEVKLHASL